MILVLAAAGRNTRSAMAQQNRPPIRGTARFLTVAALLTVAAHAGILPDDIGKYHRASAAPVTLTDKALWQEYGFQAGETGKYQGEGEEFGVTAWRMQDATGALGAFDWQ